MDWVRILAYITGTVDQELLLCNEYRAAENRILKAQLKTPVRLTDAEWVTLAEIALRLGCEALEDVANTAKPDTIMGRYLNTSALVWCISIAVKPKKVRPAERLK
jgi:putative transposase